MVHFVDYHIVVVVGAHSLKRFPIVVERLNSDKQMVEVATYAWADATGPNLAKIAIYHYRTVSASGLF